MRKRQYGCQKLKIEIPQRKIENHPNKLKVEIPRMKIENQPNKLRVKIPRRKIENHPNKLGVEFPQKKLKTYQKNLKIEFHRTYLVMALGFVLTGYYLNLIVFTSLILVHEMGHYLMARLNHFHVTKIVIYPYGGMTKIEDMINRDISEELLIATSGVITQYIFYLFMGYCCKEGIIREYTYNLYTLYNNQMIFFNLLPIYPLDGSKILNLILDKYFPYYRANLLTIVISFMMIIIIILSSIYKHSYSNIMVMGLLLTYLYQFYQKRKYLYHKFLLERYLYSIEYPQIKVIKDMKKMYKNKSHLILKNNHYQKEQEVLSSLFNKKDLKKEL